MTGSGASIPSDVMMHFPLFQISPYFQKIFRLCGKFSKFYLSRKISRFSSAKISDDPFLVKIHKFRIPPVFPVSVHFPLFRENYYSPHFQKFPPVFEKFTSFLHTLCVFRFSSTLTVMHLCITQCTYWTPLDRLI